VKKLNAALLSVAIVLRRNASGTWRGLPAFAAMTVFVSARHPHTTVIPAQAGIHASFSERNRHRERKALTEQEPHFFTGSEVGIRAASPGESP